MLVYPNDNNILKINDCIKLLKKYFPNCKNYTAGQLKTFIIDSIIEQFPDSKALFNAIILNLKNKKAES